MNDRERALLLLKERRGFEPGGLDWQWRTAAAWKHLQRHMGKPVNRWTDTPPGRNFKEMTHGA